MAYPRRVFKFIANSPALLLVDETESPLGLVLLNPDAVVGVSGKLGAFLTCPLAVLFVPFVENAGDVTLMGLTTAEASS
jgi:hypothetical protein